MRRSQPGTQSFDRVAELIAILVIRPGWIDAIEQTQSFPDRSNAGFMTVAIAKQLEEFRVVRQGQRGVVDEVPADRVQRRNQLVSRPLKFGSCRLQRKFDATQLVGVVPPNREIGLIERGGQSGLLLCCACIVQFRCEHAGTLLKLGQPCPVLLDLNALLAGQFRQRFGQPVELSLDPGKFIPSACKTDCALDVPKAAGGGLRLLELRLELIELIDAPLQTDLFGLRRLNVFRCGVVAISFPALAVLAYRGEQARTDVMQIEPA
ncbi:hypothetical protein [Candidatus Rariloculus sp.]|uniref:hypothetical protein n=1 Tax=Candidatus Rariloculus sp. TaxID=3101265 RepID=UPI003D0EE9AC